MHDTRMRGRGEYIYKVFYRKRGETDRSRWGSIIVRVPRPVESAIRARARGELDNDNMQGYDLTTIEPYKPLGG